MSMTDEQLQIAERVANYLAPRMKFSYLEIADIKQECMILAMEAIKKYEPNKGASLHTFVHMYVRNRLLNFKRDNYVRPIPKNASKEKQEAMSAANDLKRSLLSPAPSISNKFDIIAKEEFEEDERTSFLEYCKLHIPIEYMSEFNCLLDGGSIPKHRKNELVRILRELHLKYEGQA